MNGRVYDYNIGRFLSVDPFIQEPGNSQSFNPYSYILNNPLSGTDPSGYAAKTDAIAPHNNRDLEERANPGPGAPGETGHDYSEEVVVTGNGACKGMCSGISINIPYLLKYLPIDLSGRRTSVGGSFGEARFAHQMAVMQDMALQNQQLSAELSALHQQMGPYAGFAPFLVGGAVFLISPRLAAMIYMADMTVAAGDDVYIPMPLGLRTPSMRQTGAIGDLSAKIKPSNLPAWKSIKIDMSHIISGHTKDGARVSAHKNLFSENMSASQIEKVIRQAYKHGEKVKTQGDRVLIRGNNIEMWVNTKTKVIETAYPLK